MHNTTTATITELFSLMAEALNWKSVAMFQYIREHCCSSTGHSTESEFYAISDKKKKLLYDIITLTDGSFFCHCAMHLRDSQKDVRTEFLLPILCSHKDMG